MYLLTYLQCLPWWHRRWWPRLNWRVAMLRSTMRMFQVLFLRPLPRINQLRCNIYCPKSTFLLRPGSLCFVITQRTSAKMAAIQRNRFYGKWSRATAVATGRDPTSSCQVPRATPAHRSRSGRRACDVVAAAAAEIETSAALPSTAIDIRRNSRGRRAGLAVWLDCLLDTAARRPTSTGSATVVPISQRRAIIARTVSTIRQRVADVRTNGRPPEILIGGSFGIKLCQEWIPSELN